MDNILRSLEDLSRTELVWLNTYLTGRLRALPPENEQQPHPLPKAMPPCRSRCLEPPTRMDRLMLRWLLCLRELMRWATHWTHGSVRALPHKAGQPTSSRQWCLSRAISNCDHKQVGLFLLSVSVARLHPGAMATLSLGCSMLPGVLGRLLHRWASSLVILSARTPAGTADVDLVMSELSMMTTLAIWLWTTSSTPRRSAWCPLAAPADAGLWILVYTMYLPTMCGTRTTWASRLYGMWACYDLFHPCGGWRSLGCSWMMSSYDLLLYA